MNQIILANIMIFTLIIAVVVLTPTQTLNSAKTLEWQENHQSEIVDSRHKIIIEELNEKNRQIKSISSDRFNVKIFEHGFRFRLYGNLVYVKDLNFRFEVWSIMGKELDIGSNPNIFWYWSRRDRLPALYWARHEDFHKTRLKTPFDPLFLKASLGVEPIDYHNAKISESNKSIMVTNEKFDSLNRPILYSVFIDKSELTISGFIITDLNGKILATCDILKQDNLPVKITYNWLEENRMMEWELTNLNINKSFNSKIFDLPQGSFKKINMIED